jgi:aconitate hydratase
MSDLKTVMKSIVRGLKAVTKEAEKMEKIVAKLEAQAKKAPSAKTKVKAKKKTAARKAAPKKKAKAKGPRKETAVDAILKIIKQSKTGATTAQIKAKTGFSERKIWDNVNRLKRQGRVKGAGRGLYKTA